MSAGYLSPENTFPGPGAALYNYPALLSTKTVHSAAYPIYPDMVTFY